MTFVHTGTGCLGEAIIAAVIAFLVLLAFFVAVIVIIACRYHTSRPTALADTHDPHHRASCTPATQSRQLKVTSAKHR